MTGLVKLFIALFITLLNGFFVMAEYSLIRIRKSRLDELIQQGNNRAGTVLKMSEKMDTYLSATQLGITASSLLLGWFGGPLLADFFRGLFGVVAGSWYDNSLIFACAFLLIVFLHVVFGELVPRTIALGKVEQVAMAIAYPLVFFHYLLYPLVVCFNRIAHAVLCLLGVDPVPDEDISRSEDELRMIVSASERGGKLDHMESRLIDNVFDFADRVAREVMVPRQDMICLYTDDTLKENLQAVRESRHTRYPLCDEDKDHVVGVIHVRDLMDLDVEDTDIDLRTLMREIAVVPEGMSTSKVLQTMQHKRIQIAVVADEYGGTAGLVTMEDLLEEIVGDIQDEHDAEEAADILRISEDVYEFDGLILLDEVSELLHIEFDEPEEDTIGGFVFGLLGRKPEEGDRIVTGGWRFEVMEAEGFRVTRVKISRLPEDGTVEETNE